MAGAPRLFRIDQPFDGRLSVTERPLGFEELENEVMGWRSLGIGAIVSMMEDGEAEELGLGHEASLCADYEIDFISCPVRDRAIPRDLSVVAGAVERALRHLADGRHVAAHCYAGIGRSPLFVAAVLVHHGLPAREAWGRLSAARGLRVPDTGEQQRWLDGWEDWVRAKLPRR
jgi:protein-tyrosine phosphatase